MLYWMNNEIFVTIGRMKGLPQVSVYALIVFSTIQNKESNSPKCTITNSIHLHKPLTVWFLAPHGCMKSFLSFFPNCLKLK